MAAGEGSTTMHVAVLAMRAGSRRLLPPASQRPLPMPSSPQCQQLLDEICGAQALGHQHPHLLPNLQMAVPHISRVSRAS